MLRDVSRGNLRNAFFGLGALGDFVGLGAFCGFGEVGRDRSRSRNASVRVGT
jgi:hypothetical protein